MNDRKPHTVTVTVDHGNFSTKVEYLCSCIDGRCLPKMHKHVVKGSVAFRLADRLAAL